MVMACDWLVGSDHKSPNNGPITIAIRARFDYDSATTRYEVFRALAYEIVYENQCRVLHVD